MKSFTILLLLAHLHSVNSQNEIELNEDGILFPRLSTLQIAIIENPENGLTVYNTDIQCPQYLNGTDWVIICGALKDDPTLAYAGEDRTTTLESVHLSANQADGLGESGQWSIIDGIGGSFSDATDPNAIFMHDGNKGKFLLRWTIKNPCGNTYDDVEVNFLSPGIYVSYRGSDLTADGSPINPL
jgi:hypothetical protein